MASYFAIMSFMSFVLGTYALAIAKGWHQLRTRKPLSEEKLAKVRKGAGFAAPALYLLALVYAVQFQLG